MTRIAAIRMIATLLVGFGTIGQSLAQSQPSFFDKRYVSVEERKRPELDPRGLPVGSFQLYPYARASVGHQRNVLGLEDSNSSSVFREFGGGGSFQSDWSVHSLRVDGNIRNRRYADVGSENHTVGNIAATVRADISSESRINLNVAHRRDFQLRSNYRMISDAAEPLGVNETAFNVGYSYLAQKTRLTVSLERRILSYDNQALNGGDIILGELRDRNNDEIAAEFAFQKSPNLAFFASASFADRNFDEDNSERFGLRDSQLVRVFTGVEFAASQRGQGRIALGILGFIPDNDAIDGTVKPLVDASIDWFASEVLTVTVKGKSDNQPPAFVAASGIDRRQGALAAAFEVRRNVIVKAEASYASENYDGLDRKDRIVRGDLSARWMMNRNVDVEAKFSLVNVDSNGLNPGRSLDDRSVSIALTLKF